MTKINVTLSQKGIRYAIEETKKQSEWIKQRCDEFAKRMAEEGVRIAREGLAQGGKIITPQALADIRCKQISPGRWMVYVDGAWAWYVEYGTGPAGKKHPHPDGGVTHRSAPWFTRADGKDMAALYGWKPLEDAEGNIYYRTFGQPATAFMHDSKEWLSKPELINRIAKEVFDRD